MYHCTQIYCMVRYCTFQLYWLHFIYMYCNLLYSTIPSDCFGYTLELIFVVHILVCTVISCTVLYFPVVFFTLWLLLHCTHMYYNILYCTVSSNCIGNTLGTTSLYTYVLYFTFQLYWLHSGTTSLYTYVL